MVILVVSASVGPASAPGLHRFDDPLLPPGPGNAPAPCPAQAHVRTVLVTALRLPVSYNRWGDFDPEGRIFVMTDLVDEVLQQVTVNLGAAALDSGDRILQRTWENLTVARDAYLDDDLLGAVEALSLLSGSLFRDLDLTNARIAATEADEFDPFLPTGLVQPLVVRANVGDCVQIFLTNLLPEAASIHVHSAVAKPGQGLAVGTNLPDLTAPGLTSLYTTYIPNATAMEGAHFLHSHGDSRYQTRHGLFGAIAAEPYGATWESPTPGALVVGPAAMIDMPPGERDFREFVLFYHDEVELWNVLHVGPNGNAGVLLTLAPMPTISPYGEYGPGSKGLNLRSEPFMDRFELHDRLNTLTVLPRGHDKSQVYGSYTYGDPATLFAESYLGDPVKWRLVNAGPGQHHVHHLHGGGTRWRVSPFADDPQFDLGLTKRNDAVGSKSDRVDVQNIGPGESYNAVIEGGSGGVQQSVGDFLYHCHIVEHYVAGMWSFWRVYNTNQSHLLQLPDIKGDVPDAVNSTGLLDQTYEGHHIEDDASLDAWVRPQLPPKGEPVDNDASRWDWDTEPRPGLDLYLGEPETPFTWANWVSADPQCLVEEPDLCPRPEMLFNPENGRLAWPLLRPHLGKRPPFAPGHGPSPYLGPLETADRPDGLCEKDSLAQGLGRDYDLVALSTNVSFNHFDWDINGQIFVRAEDKQEAIEHPDRATSLVIRANQGDCVNVTLTSQLRFDESKVNVHIHLVQFDVQASDGVVTGFAYEQTVRPAHTGTALDGDHFGTPTTITVEDGTGLDVDTVIGIGLTGDNLEIRTVVARNGNQVTLDAALSELHFDGEHVGHEFVRYQWYPDVELGTVYWHDHVDGLRSWMHGLFGTLVVEPRYSRWCVPESQQEPCEVQLDGPNATIENEQDADRSFREVVLQFQDRGCFDRELIPTMEATRCSVGGNLPTHPKFLRTDVPASFNLRAEPLHRRNREAPLANDVPYADPAQGTQDDPPTPLVRAYPGDPVMVRLVESGQTTSSGVATFAITGHRFRAEANLTGSRVVDTLSLGISSQHDFELLEGAGGPHRLDGDYLYYMTNPDLLDRGAWGIFRVHGEREDDLRVLPNNDFGEAPPLGGLPPPTRYYDVVAMEAEVTYNQVFGLRERRQLFVLEEEVEAVEEGTLNPMPLVLRALAGETVQVNLTNDLPAGNVSLHAALLWSDPDDGLGIYVGDNEDTTIGPGQQRSYRWHADSELGTAYLTSLGQLLDAEGRPFSPASAGLYGALVVEPDSGTDPDPWTGTTSDITVDSVVHREHVLFYASDDEQFETSTMPYFVNVTGNTTVNYRTEPLDYRVGGREIDLGFQPEQPLSRFVTIGGVGIHSCDLEPQNCGQDAIRFEFRNPLNAAALVTLLAPATPVLDAEQGQPLLIRAVGGAGDQLQVHSVSGHWWAQDPDIGNCRFDVADCDSNLVSAVTLGPREVSNAWIPEAGPGGAGDYLWSTHRDAFLEDGAWGVLRVCDELIPLLGLCDRTDLVHSALTLAGSATATFRDIQEAMFRDTEGCVEDPLACINEELEDDSCLDDAPASAKTVDVPPAARNGAPGNPTFGGFTNRCVAVLSNGVVTWKNWDPRVPHDPASLADAPDEGARSPPACFKAAWDRDGDHDQLLTRPGAMPGLTYGSSAASTFAVKFRYDGSALSVSMNGGLLWRDCTDLIDPDYSDGERATIRYRCDEHPEMRGEVVVRKTTGGLPFAKRLYEF